MQILTEVVTCPGNFVWLLSTPPGFFPLLFWLSYKTVSKRYNAKHNNRLCSTYGSHNNLFIHQCCVSCCGKYIQCSSLLQHWWHSSLLQGQADLAGFRPIWPDSGRSGRVQADLAGCLYALPPSQCRASAQDSPRHWSKPQPPVSSGQSHVHSHIATMEWTPCHFPVL